MLSEYESSQDDHSCGYFSQIQNEIFFTRKCIANLVSTFTYNNNNCPYFFEGERHFQLAYHQHCFHSLPDVLFDYFPIPIFHFPSHCNSSFGNYFGNKWYKVNT